MTTARHYFHSLNYAPKRSAAAIAMAKQDAEECAAAIREIEGADAVVVESFGDCWWSREFAVGV